MNTVATPKPLLQSKDVCIRDAHEADAQQLVAMYESALGVGGVGGPNQEPYPDPSLFSVDGMLANIGDRSRQIIVAELDGRIVGAMIVDWLSPFHCENNCMAVAREARGLGIGSLLVQGVSVALDNKPLVINCTEVVTHSLASQAAHIRQGYDVFCGFGYAHYSRVFFPDHPESVLWVWRLFGQVSRWLRSSLTDTSMRNQPNCSMDGNSTVPEALLVQLKQIRDVYIPTNYSKLILQIVSQISDSLRYHLSDTALVGSGLPQIQIDPKEGYEHFYIHVNACGVLQVAQKELRNAIEAAKSASKRFILVRINANDPGCPQLANWLREQQFVFHSFLPLYWFDQSTEKLTDVLCLQWVAPDIVVGNSLPGETNSVIKVYGFPANLTADIIGTIRQELRKA